MEPLIPVNVNDEMLSDASMNELNLIGPSPTPHHGSSHGTLTHDEAVALVGRLSDENRQLKGAFLITCTLLTFWNTCNTDDFCCPVHSCFVHNI